MGLRGLEPDIFHAMVGLESADDTLRALIECTDVQTLPPPRSPGAPQFAPHLERPPRRPKAALNLGCRWTHCQVVFQAQTGPFEGPFGGLPGGLGRVGGPEQLINMATGQRPPRFSA